MKKKVPKDLSEEIGTVKRRRRTGTLFESGVSSRPGDIGPTGEVGMPEVLSPEMLDAENTDEQDLARIPGDLRDIGDPEAGDEGVPGGLASGGEESLGGTGGVERSVPGRDTKLNPEDMAGMGGTGSVHDSPKNRRDNQDKRNRKTKPSPKKDAKRK